MRLQMITLDARLASFKPKTRRRSSVTTNASKRPAPFKWPHPDLAPERLAYAGFWFSPMEESDDKVCCFLCEKCLDGWEVEDDPIAEHLRHSSDCGWAVTVAIQHGIGDVGLDPIDPSVVDARLQTFGEGLWPHEGQGAGNLNIDRMVDAGFHYFPTKDANDNAFCPYCEVELANWEPEDDPFEEHRRRAEQCPFIVSRTKKPRRRPSRASIQSIVSDLDDEPKRGRKAAKGKTATKGRGKKAARSPSMEPPAESDSQLPKRGRKRASNASQNSHAEPVIIYDGTKNSEDEAEIEVAPNPRPVKRRTRASTAQKFDILDNEGDSFPQATKTGRNGRKGATAKSVAKATTKKSRENLDEYDDGPLDTHLGDASFEDPPVTATSKPFVRATRRNTRSRASIMVEQEAKNAPEDILIHTARRPRSKPPGQVPDSIQRSPVKPFFKDHDQDYSIPIKIPSHYPQEETPELDAPALPSETEEDGHDSEGDVIMEPPKPVRGRRKKATKVAETKASSRAKKPAAGGRGRKKELEPVPVDEVPDSDVPEDKAMPDVSVEPSPLPTKKPGNRSSRSTRQKTPSPAPVPVEEPEEPEHEEHEVKAEEHDFPPAPAVDATETELDHTEIHLNSDDTIPDPNLPTDDNIPESESPTTPSSPSPTHINQHPTPEIPPSSPPHHPTTIPVTSTPTTKYRPKIMTTHPWTPADLQDVFPEPKDTDAMSPVELTEEEKAMTVEEWIKWNAAAAERRHCELAEKRVKLLEEHGRRAVAALEGIQIC
ncbi:hypothetical protein EX30DRAFT_392474 [Ascodesmis nigricans]|uniref:BIR-domain-containing protein n=1 Tax=Ascodesmis nigricans TaxID=341454 RepID=A0A4S2N6X4_9PEZI|nr:hypothetical protein EX30DRAFT_392474 [Ascodesmis nigricans]